MVTVSALEAESGLAGRAHAVLGDRLGCFDHNVAVWTGTKPQVGVAPAI